MKKVFIEKLKQVKDDLAVYEPNSLVHINYVYLTLKKKKSYPTWDRFWSNFIAGRKLISVYLKEVLLE